MSKRKLGDLIHEVHDKRMWMLGQMIEGNRRGDLSDIPNLRLKSQSLSLFEDELLRLQKKGQKTISIEQANKILEGVYGKMKVNPWRNPWERR